MNIRYFRRLVGTSKMADKLRSLRLIILSLLLFQLSQELSCQINILPDSTLVCQVDSVFLDAGPGYLSYLWSTNQTTQSIYASSPGWYYVWCTTENFEVIQDSTFVFFFKASINQPDTIRACYKSPLLFSASPFNFIYQWSSDDPRPIISNPASPVVQVIPEKDTTWIFLSVTDPNNILTCRDSTLIILYPRMKFTQVNQINKSCPGTCRGQLQVIVSGGLPPYSYYWPNASPPQYDSIAFGLCKSTYRFEVTDQYGCMRDTLLNVKVHDMPKVTIKRDPDEQIYIQNPVVKFSFENASADSIQIIDWNWDFGDSTYSKLENPEKVFNRVREYEVKLKYTTSLECIDSVSIKVDIAQAKIIIPNVFTPNGDGYNDFFKIKDLEYYISNELSVFNRYGKKVYSTNNYQSDWDGGNLKDGVYFYVLRARGYFGTDVFKGSVTIMRGP